MTQLRVAVVGCGVISGILSTKVYPELAGQATVVAAVDRRPDRTESFATMLADASGTRPRCYTSLADALRDEDIDAVDVRVPHAFHAEVALEALERGKHVLVEKPMATNLADARAMMDAARRVGVVLAVAENYAVLEATATVRLLLAEGAIGVLLSARTQRVCDITGMWTRDGWRTDAAAGGGVLLDQGCHHTSVVRNTLGPVAAVQAMASARHPTWVGEDSVSVQCRMVDGPVVQQLYCWGSPTPRPGPEASYYGTDGSIELDMGYGPDAGGLWLYRPSAKPERVGDVRYDETFTPLVEDWLRAAVEGRPAKVSGEEGFADLAVVAAGYRSLASGREEPVEQR